MYWALIALAPSDVRYRQTSKEIIGNETLTLGLNESLVALSKPIEESF